MIDLPVADPWFICEHLEGGITHVSEPHVHPLLRCNVWHVHGRSTDLVIDTSLGLAPMRHLVERTDPSIVPEATKSRRVDPPSGRLILRVSVHSSGAAGSAII